MSLEEFKQVAEETLLELLARPASKIPEQNPLVMDAIIQMIRTRGSKNLSSLLKDIHASERQLERFFAQTLSLSPKKVSSLIRYQSLWQSVCFSKKFDIQDAVADFGYFDQSHLLNDFKKFHGMTLAQARKIALGAK
jgi:methylphosphotriester-DNA--protein-cysteine methyltransferase